MPTASLRWIPAMILAGVVWIAPLARAQKPGRAAMDLEAAAKKELVEGDLKAAIGLYEKVISQYSRTDRGAVAKALLRMGQCYEKLGSAEAGKAYEQIINDYSDQQEAVAQAKTLLAGLRESGKGAEKALLTVRRLLADKRVSFNGEISPDGHFISMPNWETNNLAVLDLRTGEMRDVTRDGSLSGTPAYPGFSRWSPDGKSVAYYWSVGKEIEIRVIPAAGGVPKTLLKRPYAAFCIVYDWHPDGRGLLAACRKDDKTFEFAAVSVADSAYRVIKSGIHIPPDNARFTPDGGHIVYDQHNRENLLDCDILAFPVTGGPEEAIVRHPSYDSFLGWMPGGKHLLFASDRTGAEAVWAVPMSGAKTVGPPQLLKSDVRDFASVGVSRDGSLYFGYARRDTDIWGIAIDLMLGKAVAPPSRLIHHYEGLNSWPEFSPDGKSLVYMSNRRPLAYARQKHGVLVVRDVESSGEREVVGVFGRAMRPRWSGDGKRLYVAAGVLHSSGDPQWGIHRAEVRFGAFSPVFLEPWGIYVVMYDVAPDERAVYYVRNHQEKRITELVGLDLKTQEKKVLLTGAYNARILVRISPDGRTLALANLASGKERIIGLLPSEGGTVRELYRSPNTGDLEWTPDGKSLLFTKPRPGQKAGMSDLWLLPLDGAEPKPFGADLTGDRFTIHPDGRRVAFESRSAPFGEVWVMENIQSALAGR